MLNEGMIISANWSEEVLISFRTVSPTIKVARNLLSKRELQHVLPEGITLGGVFVKLSF